MNNVRIRLSMLIGSAAVIVIDLFFLWVLNLNETQEIQQMLRFCILILGGAALITAALFFIAGPFLSLKIISKSNDLLRANLACNIIFPQGC